MKTFSAIASLALAAGLGSAQVAITEVFAGLSGEDGTQDWIEITNLGSTDIDTGTLFYDDENPAIGNAGQLDSFVLAAGQSAIFLLEAAANNDLIYSDSITEFRAIWNYTGLVGLTNGGGNLGQNGDQANLLDSAGNVLSSATFSGGLGGQLFTIDYVSGSGVLSALGVNGAYESIPFFNDNLGLPNDTAVLVGSPGLIPAPGAAAGLALLGLAGIRRRR